MLVEEWRPSLFCKDFPCDNMSPDKKVFFIEDGHRYYHEDDIIDGKLVSFNNSKYKFKSPTGILSKFKEGFDSVAQAKKYVKKHKLDITWQEQKFLWDEKGRIASEEGTLLHAYGEALWNKWDMETPNASKAAFVDEMYKELSSKYILVKTELLVYSLGLRIAGQVDLLMKDTSGNLILLDYKFLKKPLDKKSFYNPRTRRYKFMKGPFKKLHDCNYSHYSIQMSMYQMLMGKVGNKIKNKVLIVVTPEGVNYEEGIEMSIWVTASGVLHARYIGWNGKVYDSSKDKSYLKNVYYII